MDIMNAVLCSSEKDLPPQVPQAVIEHAKTFATSALRRFLELGDESTRLALREALASAPDRSFFTARMDAYDSAFMRRGGNLQHGLEDAAREFARLATAQPEIFAASHATIVVMTQFAAVRDTLASYRIR
jgi:hypothetical protein